MKKAEEIYHRQFVDVLAFHRKDGTLEIREICWPDGRVFPVENTIGGTYEKSLFSGGTGRKYTVTIRGRKRDIYCAKDRFFVDVPGISPEMVSDFPESILSEEDLQDITYRYLLEKD